MTAVSQDHKKTVLLLFGGESPEHEVSLLSARNVYAALDKRVISPVLCFIDKQGRWWYVDDIMTPSAPTVHLTPILGTSSVQVEGQEIPINVIFPVLHGANGEDGTVQGLAKLLHTPVVGCGIVGSVLCIDKILTKKLLEAAGIPVVPFKTYNVDSAFPYYPEIAKHLGDTLFVKPAHLGSSIGVGKVRTKESFEAIFKEAAMYDSDVLVEQAIDGVRELEVAVFGPTHKPEVSSVGEIVPDRDFYSYESKYDEDATSSIIIPAHIESSVAEQIRGFAAQAYAVLHCQGLARIDFFVDKNEQIYLNEVNTMPGFTDISMYPKLWEAAGVSYEQLVTMLIDEAK